VSAIPRQSAHPSGLRSPPEPLSFRSRALRLAVNTLPTFRAESRALAHLAWPIVLTNLGWMMLGTVDTIMLGWLSKEALAASLLGNVWVHLTQIAAMGVIMGMDPLVTQGHGAGDRRKLALALQRGLVLGTVLAVPLVLSRFYTADVLDLFRQLAERIGGPEAAAGFDPAIARDAHRYALSQAAAEPFFLAYIAQRQYLQGRGILRPALIVTAIAIVMNAMLNQLFIFELGYGIVGAGAATALTRAFLALGVFYAIRRFELHRGAWVRWSRASVRGLGELLRYGLPVGAHFALEVGAFGISTLIAGLLGVVATAAHGIVINISSVTFMLPLGVSLAAVTRVGNLIGAGQHGLAQRSAWLAIAMGAGLMACAALVMLALRWMLPRLYSADVDVIAAAAAVLPIAAAFQVFDGVQVVGGGVLRGMGRTVPPAVFNFIAWYVVGLPLAWYWAVTCGYGVTGLWWALAIGLAAIALLLVAWIKHFGPASSMYASRPGAQRT
jgi:MATE family multidrug resistance protein